MRKIGEDEALQQACFGALDAVRLLEQKHSKWNKLYNVHAPEVECIGKGKTRKKYEFGVQVSLVAASKEGFVIGAQALHGNPYDGHTLGGALAQAGELTGGELTGDVFVDLGYRKHNDTGEATVHLGGRKLGEIPRKLAKWMKRRAAIEPVIGHMKSDERLGRNDLLGQLGDKLNAVMCACGHNLRLMLGKLRAQEGRRLIFVLWRWLWSWLGGVIMTPGERSAFRPEPFRIGF